MHFLKKELYFSWFIAFVLLLALKNPLFFFIPLTMVAMSDSTSQGYLPLFWMGVGLDVVWSSLPFGVYPLVVLGASWLFKKILMFIFIDSPFSLVIFVPLFLFFVQGLELVYLVIFDAIPLFSGLFQPFFWTTPLYLGVMTAFFIALPLYLWNPKRVKGVKNLYVGS